MKDEEARPDGRQVGLVFLHHSCGRQWLARVGRWRRRPGLHDALLAKPYIDQRNDITYGVMVPPDPGRPDSLGPVAGDRTDMCHWVLWFNDYLAGVKKHGCADGENRVLMFKSCFPLSNIAPDGTGPGDPFSDAQTVANYQAVYRHPDGPSRTYEHAGAAYAPLEAVFERNPDTLFIPVTAPPRHYAPKDATSDDEAGRARAFNTWLKHEWLAGYKARTGLANVAVFDWFDLLAYPDDHTEHPNRLRREYGGDSGDSHPANRARLDSTDAFATAPGNFIDAAWEAFIGPTGRRLG